MTDAAQTVEDGNQGFSVNPRTVPVELLPNFDHAVFLPEPTVKERLLQVSVMDRLDDVMRNRIAEMFQ